MTARDFLLSLGLVACMAGTAQAQDETAFVEAFSGDWFVFEPAYGTGNATCQLDLDTAAAPSQEGYQIATQNCAAPIRDTSAWMIRDGQILLQDADGGTLARLGGNQRRISGEISGAPRESIIVERASGDGNSARLSEALAVHGCIFLGFTDRCAEEELLAGQGFASTGPERIKVLVNLNVRAQPRADAPVLGTIPAETDVTVRQCLVASDGLWCSAEFGDQVAWMARTALRQDEWPVATFIPAPQESS